MKPNGMKVIVLIAALAFAVTSCGVKSDLVQPNGKATAKGDKDPSKPPYPMGR